MPEIIYHTNAYFTERELACPCCGQLHMDQPFMDKLLNARVLAGIPFIANSAFRCFKHNQEVGSITDNHPTGRAIDISCNSDRTRFIIVSALIRAGITGIVIHPTFIHADSNHETPVLCLAF